MPETQTSTDTIDIKVATPLPSSVVLTLGALIEAAWPGSGWASNEDRYVNQVIFRVDNSARRQVPDEEAAALRVEAGPEDADVIALGPEGASVLTPTDVAANLLPVIKTAFEEFPDAANYLEMPVFDPEDGHRYLLTFCRSAAQTPHELRVKAEKALEEARASIHRDYAAAAWGVRAQPRGTAPDTYEAGVKAVLDVIRQMGFPYGADDDEP